MRRSAHVAIVLAALLALLAFASVAGAKAPGHELAINASDGPVWVTSNGPDDNGSAGDPGDEEQSPESGDDDDPLENISDYEVKGGDADLMIQIECLFQSWLVIGPWSWF